LHKFVFTAVVDTCNISEQIRQSVPNIILASTGWECYKQIIKESPGCLATPEPQ